VNRKAHTQRGGWTAEDSRGNSVEQAGNGAKDISQAPGRPQLFSDVGMVAPSKVPAPLMVSTIKTGLSLVAGGEAAGVASGNAILLSQGVMKAMLMMKLKSVVTADRRCGLAGRWRGQVRPSSAGDWAGHGGREATKQLLLNRNRQVNYSPGK